LGTLLLESGFVVVMLVGLGLAGGFAILPFRRSSPFLVLAAPLAGMLCISLTIAGFYSLAGWSFQACVIAATTVCWGATLGGLILTRPRLPWKQVFLVAALVVAVAAVATRICEAATIHFHGPGLLFCDGTDAMGYAHVADWVISHKVLYAPDTFTRLPYQAYLAYLFRVDSRFGCYFFLALVAMVRHVPGPFAYDMTTAIVLSASVLGVSAAFARSRGVLILLAAGLMCSHWYEYGRTGFLGKACAYPAVILLMSLYFALPEGAPLALIFLLAVLTGGTALMHSGLAPALYLASVIGPYLLLRFAWEPRNVGKKHELIHRGMILVVLIAVSILTSGVIARPVTITLQEWQLTWDYVAPRIMDLEHHGATITGFDEKDQLRPPLLLAHQGNPVSGMGPRTLKAATAVAAFMWFVLGAVSVRRRDPVAAGLLIGPALLLAAFFAGNSSAAAFQLIGLIYPLTLCGGVRLLRQTARSNWLIFLTLILAVALRVPRFAGSAWRYAGSAMPPKQLFSLTQMTRLTKVIGDRPVEVDMWSPTHAIFVLVELGGRDVKLQWTPQSWYTVLSYTHWPYPDSPPAPLKLQMAGGPVPAGYHVIYRATPFRLLERK
jgi:hypothetical protein